MIQLSNMYFWHLYLKNCNQIYRGSLRVSISLLTTFPWERSFRSPKDVWKNHVNRNSSSKNCWKTKSISVVYAKSLTYISNARKRRIVIAAPKRISIFASLKIQTCFLDQNLGESHTNFSRKDLVLSENRKGKSQADASSARKKAIMLKIVPTKKIKPSGFLSTYKPPLIILLTKMKLSSISQNKRSPLMKRCSHYKTHPMILKMTSFRLFFTNNFCRWTLTSISLPSNFTSYPPNSRDQFPPLDFLIPEPKEVW